MKKKLNSVFKKEYAVLRNAERINSNAEIEIDALKIEYSKLLNNYKEILKHTEKITNIGDINQMKLLVAKRQARQQQKHLEETAILRENVERIIHHDLKNPLHAIISLPAFLLKKTDLNEKEIMYLETIRQSGERMLEIINRSLDMYKMELKTYSLKPVRLELLAIIHSVVASLRAIDNDDKPVEIMFEDRMATNKDRFYIMGEELLCFSLLSNLIKNAQEASPDNGVVTIVLSGDREKYIGIHNHGIIPEDMCDCFFEKYRTQDKKGGTGLGTYSAKLITETLGGHIEFETSEEHGTKLIISLPSAD